MKRRVNVEHLEAFVKQRVDGTADRAGREPLTAVFRMRPDPAQDNGVLFNGIMVAPSQMRPAGLGEGTL